MTYKYNECLNDRQEFIPKMMGLHEIFHFLCKKELKYKNIHDLVPI